VRDCSGFSGGLTTAAWRGPAAQSNREELPIEHHFVFRLLACHVSPAILTSVETSIGLLFIGFWLRRVREKQRTCHPTCLKRSWKPMNTGRHRGGSVLGCSETCRPRRRSEPASSR